jgi:peptidyl-prolyl cis-trans isomerase SurA
MKIKLTVLLFLAFLSYKSQYLIIGKDSVSVQKFREENKYGLETAGINSSIKTYTDFKLLQQFAIDKKADTLSYFKAKMAEKNQQLREESFYPKPILQSALNEYLSANLVENKIQVFYVQKTENDTNDYKKIYEEVKNGTLKIEDAILKYSKLKAEPFFVKAGTVDIELEKELQSLQSGNYTKLINTPTLAAFAKLVERRPSLGYIIFGTISYPKSDAEKMKTQIFEALKSGKKFEEVAKLYGSTDTEKNNAGIVMGSPVLPDEVYAAFKGKKEGEYTEPVLLGDKYFVFNIYSLIPYQNSEKHNKMFVKEMMSSQYSDVAYDKLVNSIVKSSKYKETPDFEKVKKSYQDFLNFKNDKAVLYQFGKTNFTFESLKKVIAENFKNADKLPADQWKYFVESKRNSDVFAAYSKDFSELPEIKSEMNKLKQNLLADYIFSYYIENELKKPEILDEYYQKHKDKYVLESRADGRVAILTDLSVEKDITKEIENPKNWENLNKKYYGKLDGTQQLQVHFEEGEMSENADVFKIYKVPFQKGVHKVKMDKRLLIIAIDEILPPSQMSRQDAEQQLKTEVTEEILTKTIQEQRNKTKITLEPAFMADLEKNFKK